MSNVQRVPSGVLENLLSSANVERNDDLGSDLIGRPIVVRMRFRQSETSELLEALAAFPEPAQIAPFKLLSTRVGDGVGDVYFSRGSQKLIREYIAARFDAATRSEHGLDALSLNASSRGPVIMSAI